MNKVDSLKTLIERELDRGNTKIALENYLKLGRVYDRERRYSLAKSHYQVALSIAQKSQSELITLFYNRLSVDYWQEQNYDSALWFCNQAIIYGEKHGQHQYIEDAQLMKGYIYYSKGELPMAVESFLTAINNTKNPDSLNLASINLNLGISYRRLSIYDKALTHLLKASLIYKNLDNQRQLSSSYNSVANTYNEMGQIKNALEFHFKSLDIATTLDDSIQVASSFNNIGNVFKDIDSLDKALFYHQQAFEIKRKLGDRQRLASSLNNIGEIHFKLKNYSEAINHYEQALQYASAVNDNFTIAILNNDLGELYLALGDYTPALNYLEAGRKIAGEMQTLEILRRNYELSSELAERTGNSAKALSFFKQQSILRDSIMSKEKLRALTEMGVKYETDQREKDIEVLSEQADIREQLLNQQQITIYALIGAAILLLLLAFIAYNRYLLKNKANSYIRHLMDELNHRVKNNLQVISSLLKIQSYEVADDMARDVMIESRNRVGAMALIHQKLYQQDGVSSVNMNEYIADLVKNLAGSFGYDNENTRITVSSHDLHLDVDSAIPIGLIINELTCNALKYAFSDNRDNLLDISLKEDKGVLVLKVLDNGSTPTSLGDNSDSFGLSLVKSFGKELEADVRFNYVSGTEVTLLIKRYKIPDSKLQRLLKTV